MKFPAALAAAVLVAVFGATAQTTTNLSDPEIQGRNLVQQILEQRPAENFTNSGVLKFKDANGQRREIPVVFETSISETNWSNRYVAAGTTATVAHEGTLPNEYQLIGETGKAVVLSGNETMISFAGSDFWLADLGLEFFHWPQQKVLKKEFHRECSCAVLESTNPNPATNGYARVVAWIDTNSLGIVDAFAYDLSGKKLKNFYPKNFKKVNGQYQVESMIMENLQTGSRTRLEFDLKSK